MQPNASEQYTDFGRPHPDPPNGSGRLVDTAADLDAKSRVMVMVMMMAMEVGVMMTRRHEPWLLPRTGGWRDFKQLI